MGTLTREAAEGAIVCTSRGRSGPAKRSVASGAR